LLILLLTKKGGGWTNFNENRQPYDLNLLYVACLGRVDSSTAQLRVSATFLHYAIHQPFTTVQYKVFTYHMTYINV
jgi:hypothetical protein